MKTVLVVGMHKSGTTIVSSVIQGSIAGARLCIEPMNVGFFEESGKAGVPLVVKILYEHWMQRPSLLAGIVCGETAFRPEKIVAIVRDPRDGLISELMYGAYERIVEGANRAQVGEWVSVVRDKEASPDKHSVIALIHAFNRIFGVETVPDAFFDTFMTYSAWIDANRDRFYVLRYEDFVDGGIAGLSDYLGIKLSTSRDVHPSLERVTRTRRSGGWREMMLPQDVTHWRERYGRALEACGYGEWDLRPGRPDPAVTSGCILRVADEAFRLTRDWTSFPPKLQTPRNIR